MDFVISLLAVLTLLIVLATLTTAFVETIHALLKQRLAGLRHMLQAYFTANFTKEKTAIELAKYDAAAFANEMMANPAKSEEQGSKKFLFPLVNFGNAAQFDRLDVKSFLQQLANSKIGNEIAKPAVSPDLTDQALAEAKKKLGERLNLLVAQFERFADGATEIFKRRAAIYAPFLGIGIAAFINVDGALVAKRLFSDKELAEKVVVTYPIAKLEGMIKDEKASNGSQVELRVAQAEFEKLGLPIGGRYFPYCTEDETDPAKPSVDPRCAPVHEALLALEREPKEMNTAFAHFIAHISTSSLAGWLISILITGILVGLGAPFWFDIYKKIAGLGLPGLPEAVRKAITPAPQAGGDSKPVDRPTRPTVDEMVNIFLEARPK